MILKKILLLDEEGWYVEPLIDRLEYEGYQVVYHQTIQEVLIYLEEGNQPGLAIVDMHVPFGTKELREKMKGKFMAPGLMLMEKIREGLPDLPMIGYTVSNNPEVIQAIESYGATYVSKASDNPDEIIEEAKRKLHIMYYK